MPQIKMVEIRDRMTFIPAMAIRMGSSEWFPHDSEDKGYLQFQEAEQWLQARAGIGISQESQKDCVFLCDIRNTGKEKIRDTPGEWGDRTWATAHQWIIDNWDKIESGSVIDVEFILGETKECKISERLVVILG